MSSASPAPRPVTATPAFPFRTELRPAWPLGMEPLGVDALHAVAAIAAASERGAPADTLIDHWARHPDERVRVALLCARHIALPKDVFAAIASRAFRVARSEKAVITPVIDALYVRSWIERNRGLHSATNWQALEALETRRFALEQWLRGQDDYAIAEPLLLFTSYDVHYEVINSLPNLPLAWIEHCDTVHPNIALHIYCVERLSRGTAQNLFYLILRRAAERTGESLDMPLAALSEILTGMTCSVAECARIEKLLDDTRADAYPWRRERLHELLAAALSRATLTSGVRTADLVRLLASSCDAVRRAACELAASLVYQPT